MPQNKPCMIWVVWQLLDGASYVTTSLAEEGPLNKNWKKGLF